MYALSELGTPSVTTQTVHLHKYCQRLLSCLCLYAKAGHAVAQLKFKSNALGTSPLTVCWAPN